MLHLVLLLWVTPLFASVPPPGWVPKVAALARKEGLDKSPEVEKLLYQLYLKKHLAHLSVPPETLSTHYAQYPMIRLRHLFIHHESAPEQQKEIEKALEKGVPFKKIVIDFSEDASAKWAGDLDFRGKNTLPKDVYEKGLALSIGEVSKPWSDPAGMHWIELIAKASFSEATAPYRLYLERELLEAVQLQELSKKLESGSSSRHTHSRL